MTDSQDKIQWVQPDIKGAIATSVKYSDGQTIDDFLKTAIKECHMEANHIYVAVRFEGNVLERDALVENYVTSPDNPFVLGMTEAMILKLREKAIPLIQKLRGKIEQWKPKRKETVKALKNLAKECDETHSWNNKWKFGGAILSGVTTIAGIGAVAATGGLATPFVIGGVAASLSGAAAVGVADYLNSTCSEEARQKTQVILDKEKNVYESVRKLITDLQDTLEDICVEHGWPAEEALPAFISSGSINGITVSKEGARMLVKAWTANELITDYYKVVDATREAVEGVQKAALGAKNVAEAAKKLKLGNVARNAEDAARVAEEAAKAVSKNFKTCKEAATAMEKVAEASKHAATIATTAAEDVSKASAASGIMKWFSSGVHPVGEAALKGAKVAEEGAEVAGKAAKVASKSGRLFTKLVPILNVVSLIMDGYDIYQSAGSAFGSESKVGSFIRSKADKMVTEVNYIETEVLPQLESKI